jgi:hypothetical protein
MGSAVNAVGKGIGSIVGGFAEGMTPEAKFADQSRLNADSDAQRNIGKSSIDTANDQLNRANTQFDRFQTGMNQADYMNTGGNVGTSLDLLQQAAQGNAPSAAQAQLQAGKDQAIATQQAMANSGNASQMIGGQKEAMMNAANLTQQAANQSAQLRAGEMAAARGQYANQAGTQAAQAAQNAGLKLDAYGRQMNAAGNYNQMGLAGYGGATSADLGGLNINQGVYNQRNQQQAGITGGLINAGGAAIAAGAGKGGGAAAAAAHGGVVPGRLLGHKDNYSNDKVPVMTSPGEIIVPVSALQSKKKAVTFLMKMMDGRLEDNNILKREELFKMKKRVN